MHKKILIAVLIAIGGSYLQADEEAPVKQRPKSEARREYRQKQEERKAFNEAQKNKTPAERALFFKKLNEEKQQKELDELKEKLAGSTLPQKEKDEITAAFVQWQKDNVEFAGQERAKIKALTDQLKADESLTPEQRKEKIQAFRQEQRQKSAEFKQRQNIAKQELLKKIL